MVNTLSFSIVGCRLDYCNALPYGTMQNNFNRLQRVQTCVQCTVPLSIPAITQIAALVTGHRTCRVQAHRHDVQSPTAPAAILPPPTHWPASTHSLSAFTKFYSTHRSTHQNSYCSLGFLHLRSNCLNSLPYAVRETSSQPRFLRPLKGHHFQRVFG